MGAIPGNAGEASASKHASESDDTLPTAMADRASHADRALPRPVTALAASLLVSLALFGSFGAAHAMGLPTNVCTVGFCGPAQRHMWNRFESAGGLDPHSIPGVYSGTCYHDSPAYDPNKAQYGGVLLDKADGRVFFDGKFSFFEPANPYARLNVEGARQRFPQRHELTLYEGFAYADASDPLKPFRYWIRQDLHTGALLLVGYFGYLHTILCALDRHSPDTTFRDCADCAEKVVIPARSFRTGDLQGIGDRDETPVHHVRFGRLALGKYEVMIAQWDACVAAGGCRRRPNDLGWGRGARPVIYASWRHAKEHVQWLSRRTGKHNRLPLEAEWEYAARAATAYDWGDDAEAAADHAQVRARRVFGTTSVGGVSAIRYFTGGFRVARPFAD